MDSPDITNVRIMDVLAEYSSAIKRKTPAAARIVIRLTDDSYLRRSSVLTTCDTCKCLVMKNILEERRFYTVFCNNCPLILLSVSHVPHSRATIYSSCYDRYKTSHPAFTCRGQFLSNYSVTNTPLFPSQ
jgi:hypothetical protein